MGLTQVDVVNAALVLLGQVPIPSLDDDSDAARAARALWDLNRRACLREAKPRCALRRETLPASGTAPAFGAAQAFPLPPDALAVDSVGDPPGPADDWRVEGRAIVTAMGAPLPVILVVDVPDLALWDASFADTMAARMAWALAFPVTKNPTLRNEMFAYYQHLLGLAGHSDALESSGETVGANAELLGVR